MTTQAATALVDAGDLERFGVEVFTRLAVPEADARDTVRAMVAMVKK